MTGSVLISGRNLHDLATKGAREYKKALAFNDHKWDSVQMKPKHSGDTVEDCIEYVRREMYRSTVGRFEDNEETKADSETEDIVGSEKEDGDDKVNSIQDEEGLRESNINEDNINSNAASIDSKEINNDVDIIAINSEDSMEIPDNFIFPSFFVFVVWGPYADVNNRLNLTLVNDDNNTSDRETRKDNRKRSLEEKSEESRNDNFNKRGFTTVQQIELENLNERRLERNDRQRESLIVGLSIEEAALSNSIEKAEKRAEMRCGEYDPSNIFWKKVDALIEKHEEVLKNFFVQHNSEPA